MDISERLIPVAKALENRNARRAQALFESLLADAMRTRQESPDLPCDVSDPIADWFDPIDQNEQRLLTKLDKIGIHYVGQLLKATKKHLDAQPDISEKYLAVIENKLTEHCGKPLSFCLSASAAIYLQTISVYTAEQLTRISGERITRTIHDAETKREVLDFRRKLLDDLDGQNGTGEAQGGRSFAEIVRSAQNP